MGASSASFASWCAFSFAELCVVAHDLSATAPCVAGGGGALRQDGIQCSGPVEQSEIHVMGIIGGEIKQVGHFMEGDGYTSSLSPPVS